MKTKDFYYDSDNKQNLVYAKKWFPNGEPIGIIQFIHGMTEHAGRYEDAARFFVNHGFICTINDHLGHGKTAATTRGFFGYNNGIKHLLKDVEYLKNLTQKDYPNLPFFFLGFSMGSFIERLLISERRITQNLNGAIIAGTSIENPDTSKLLRIAEDNIKLKGPKVENLEFNNTAFADINTKFPNEDDPLAWVTSNIGKREQYKNDPQSQFVFTNAGFRDLFKMIINASSQSIIKSTDKRLPLLFISGKDDPIGDFGLGVRKLATYYLNAGMDDLTVKIFPRVRHDVLFDFPATQNRSLPFILNWINARINNYQNIR